MQTVAQVPTAEQKSFSSFEDGHEAIILGTSELHEAALAITQVTDLDAFQVKLGHLQAHVTNCRAGMGAAA